jgi:PAS domain S-box-containing protein
MPQKKLSEQELLGLASVSHELAGLAAFVWDVRADTMRWVLPPERVLGAPSAGGGYPPFRDLVFGEDRAQWLDARTRAIAGRAVAPHEFRVVRADGAVRWLRASERLLTEPAGPPRLLVVLQDVTDARARDERLRRSEERYHELATSSTDTIWGFKARDAWLQQSEERYRTLAVLSADSIWEQDDRFHFVAMVPGAGDGPMAGEAAIGKTRWDPPAITTDEQHWREHRATLEAHLPFRDFEYQRLNERGQRVWISTSGVPVIDENGRFRGYRGVARNVTALREAHESVRKAWAVAESARQQLRDAIEALEDGFALFDAEDRLVMCNHRLRAFYARSADLLVPGTGIEEILRDGLQRGQYPQVVDDAESWIQAQLAAHRGGHCDYEQLVDGGRWLRISKRRTSDGGLVGFWVDITTLKEARERADAASRAKSNFLAMVSHEIRTPLTSIIGFTELALEDVREGETRESLEMIRGDAQRLLAIVNGVLDFSKIEAGRMELSISEFDLGEEVRVLIRSFEMLSAAKGNSLECEIVPRDPGRVRGPRQALQQVLTNLIVNAIKFTEGGTVRVRVALLDGGGEEAQVEAEVRDTGNGIAADQLQRIFEPFVQADNTITREFGGTGLGLSISKRLVELMGGRLSVESALGQGSTFRFTARVALVRAAGEPGA